MTKAKSSEASPLSDERCLELIDAIAIEELERGQYTYNLRSSEIGREILKLDRMQHSDLVMVMIRCSCYPRNTAQVGALGRAGGSNSVRDAMNQLLNRTLPFTHDKVIEILKKISQKDHLWWYCLAQITKVAENFATDNPLTPELEQLIGKICTKIDERQYSEHRKYSARLKQLIQEATGAIPIEAGEAWSDRAIESIESLPAAARSPWVQIFRECFLASGGKPTAKWLKTARAYRQEIGLDAFEGALLDWFSLAHPPGTIPIETAHHVISNDDCPVSDRNTDLLKGLVWLCADLPSPDLARAIGKLALPTYKLARVRLGNACIRTLGEMDTPAAVAQLAFLKVKIKDGSAQRGIDKALTAAAERLNVPRAEVEEMAVPAYGLEEVGCRREQLGDFTAELAIAGTASVELRWFKPDGKPQKSIPKAVKDNHADTLKELKQAAKDIQKMLPAQRDRIENLYLEQKTWDYAIWRERYLDHPLIGTLARRIIWEFQDSDRAAAAIWHDGNLVGRDGQPLDWLAEDTKVILWHPISSSSETILAWRDFLSDLAIEQPFKQAYRESLSPHQMPKKIPASIPIALPPTSSSNTNSTPFARSEAGKINCA